MIFCVGNRHTNSLFEVGFHSFKQNFVHLHTTDKRHCHVYLIMKLLARKKRFVIDLQYIFNDVICRFASPFFL